MKCSPKERWSNGRAHEIWRSGGCHLADEDPQRSLQGRREGPHEKRQLKRYHSHLHGVQGPGVPYAESVFVVAGLPHINQSPY